MLEVAIDKLVEAIDIEPNDPIIHFAFAELLYFDGQSIRASSEYETVLETGEYQINNVTLFSRIADCSLQSGSYSDASTMFNEISEDEMDSEIYFKTDITYEKNDLTQEAIKLVQTLLSKDPDFLQGYFYLQQLYENEHNHADAIEIGKEGLRLSQFYKELMVSTGSIQIEHGDANEG